jgi:hypothetical protein
MKRIVILCILCAGLFGLSVTANVLAQTVETVTVDFEEFADEINDDGEDHDSAYGWSWNGTNDRYYSGLFPSGFLTPTGNFIDLPAYGFWLDEYSYQSIDAEGNLKAEFYWGGWDGQAMNLWCGTGLSTVTNAAYYGFMNEMASVTGSGNGGSETYAVAYGDCWNDLDYEDSYAIRISLPSGAVVKSIAITNTVYTKKSLSDGLDGADGVSVPAPNITHAGEEFGINIYGINADGESVGSLQVTLGDWHNNAPRVLTTWKTVDLSSLVNATELRFSFYTTIVGDDSDWGFFTPAYFAFDDLVYEIEDEE